ncbi:hypothetical protein WP50_27520 [Lactiplantibacillus plantarum]|nr:hypothetical protein WP50_27520 [Lactiplantibacillus plantarum]
MPNKEDLNRKPAVIKIEITLIQKHQPYFNIKLKKGTGYPYIKITNERDPQILIVSDVRKDGGYYFGPYPNVYAAQETVNIIQTVYTLRRCHGFQKRYKSYFRAVWLSPMLAGGILIMLI